MTSDYGDALTTDFWKAARQQVLLVQCCLGCQRFQLPPRNWCGHCGSEKVVWRLAAGFGTVFTVTTVHRQVPSGPVPPYQVALVRLIEGPQLLARIIGPAVDIDSAVQVVWAPREDGPPVPQFMAITTRSALPTAAEEVRI